MRKLLTITAVLEVGTGLAFTITPSTLVWLLLGTPLEEPPGLLVGRILGSALFALGSACWLSRSDVAHRLAIGLVALMLIYNVAVASLLVHASVAQGMSGIGTWPVVLLHSVLAVSCIVCLRAAHRTAADLGQTDFKRPQDPAP